jgi:hypothetical protein
MPPTYKNASLSSLVSTNITVKHPMPEIGGASTQSQRWNVPAPACVGHFLPQMVAVLGSEPNIDRCLLIAVKHQPTERTAMHSYTQVLLDDATAPATGLARVLGGNAHDIATSLFRFVATECLAPQLRILWLGRAFPLRLCGPSVLGHNWGSSFWLLLICSLIAVRISPWMERLCCLATLRKASSISTGMRIENDFVGSSCAFIRLVYIQIGRVSRGTPLQEERAFYPCG